MPTDAGSVTFTLATVVQLGGFLLAIASSWFWLRGKFERNSDRITRVESDVLAVAQNTDQSITQIGNKIDKLSDTVVRIDTRGQILEEKFAILATPK